MVLFQQKESNFRRLFARKEGGSLKVLNFGSLNLDYVYQVDHFVAKGETLASLDLHTYCGGKGLNQSLALQKAGVSVYHAGAVGQDGGMLLDTLREAGVDVSLVRELTQVRTGNAIIQNDRTGDNCILLYGGANRAIDPTMAASVLENFSEGDWLILQTEISSLQEILALAREKGLRVVLNPSPVDENILKVEADSVQVLMLNEVEARAFVGQKDSNDALLAALQQRFPHTEIVLTLGEDGSLCAADGKLYRQSAYRVPVRDTTAAGDTFTGYYLSGRMQEKDPAQALETASRASAIAVSRPGAAASIPTPDEVERFRRGEWIPD